MYLWAGVIYFRQLAWVIRNCPPAPRYRHPTEQCAPVGDHDRRERRRRSPTVRRNPVPSLLSP